MYRAAEEGMTYMDQTLRNCEYFLIHDQDKENEELKQQQEREQKLEDQRIKEERDKRKKEEDERLKREEATKKFYEEQEALMVKEPELPKKGEKPKKGQTDQPLDGGQPENDWLAQDNDDAFGDDSDGESYKDAGS